MKFTTCYKWHYKVKGHIIFDEDLEVEVEVKNKTWNITKIGFVVKNICGSGSTKIWLDDHDDIYHIIRQDIEEDEKFNRSILNETI